MIDRRPDRPPRDRRRDRGEDRDWRPSLTTRHRALTALGLLAIIGGLAVAVALRPGGTTEGHASFQRPHVWFAAGDSSANIPLDGPDKWTMLRWVARRDGRVAKLWVHVKTEGAQGCSFQERSGYAAGTSGTWKITTHPVHEDGRPDMGKTLASETLNPCQTQDAETLAFTLDIPVKAGEELATIVRNTDPDPSANFASLNFLYRKAGIPGANGRNERDPAATDSFYALDPREIVAYSTDAGRHWQLPGGPYGAKHGTSFIPGFLQQFADGATSGQPYYSSTKLRGEITMAYPNTPVPWTISRIGAYTSARSSAPVTLDVDGDTKARIKLSGRGFISEPIDPIAVPAGSTVTLTTTTGKDGLDLRANYADYNFATLAHLGRSHPFYLVSDPNQAAPLWPLPVYSDDID